MSPLLAQSRHRPVEFRCPLLGVKQTLPGLAPMSAFDPKRTWAGRDCSLARSNPTLTTGLHFGFDDGDGFFNPASRAAFAASRLSACSLPLIGATCGPASFAFAASRLLACSLPLIGATCGPASFTFAASRLSACSLPLIGATCGPASFAFAASRLLACSLPLIGATCGPASFTFAALRLSAYSLPSIGATCGGSLSRYGRPIPSSFSCASIHFHKISLHMHLSARVSPFTLTRSAASPWP